ncbi:MAG TPA: YdeI/OmpD-associated family protein [Friedmanniella sp.]
MPAFDAEVRASGRGSHAVVVPKPVVTELGSRRVLARIGAETFEATLGAYGGRTFLGLRKTLLTTLGVSADDQVHVELEPATATPEPADEETAVSCTELDEALATDAPLHDAWQHLPEGHRDEYGRWISAGAAPDAREARITRLRHRLLPS